jgi:hypothetical protein
MIVHVTDLISKRTHHAHQNHVIRRNLTRGIKNSPIAVPRVLGGKMSAITPCPVVTYAATAS